VQLLAEVAFQTAHWAIHPVEYANFRIIDKNMNVAPVMIGARELENVTLYFAAHSLATTGKIFPSSLKSRIVISSPLHLPPSCHSQYGTRLTRLP
jgi:hypothetical protein